MTIRDVLLPMIAERFPHRGFQPGAPDGAIGSFPGMHPNVAALILYDDGDEVTVVVDPITHSHVEPFKVGTQAELERSVASEVVSFLDKVFANEVVFWGSINESGGWYVRGEVPLNPGEITNARYVWSGPLGNDA